MLMEEFHLSGLNEAASIAYIDPKGLVGNNKKATKVKLVILDSLLKDIIIPYIVQK